MHPTTLPLKLDNSTPITQPILSLASHPEFIAPLSAVLKAGRLPPGQHYSSSPAIARLSTILSQSPPKKHILNPSSPSDQVLLDDPSTTSDLSNSSMRRPSFIPSFLDNISRHSSSIKSYTYHHQTSPQPVILNTPVQTKRSPSQSSDVSCSCSTLSTTEYSSNPTVPPEDNKWSEIDHLINDFEEPHSFMRTKYPLVLCHGLFGFDILGPQALGLAYFRGVREALEKRGVEVHVARVPSVASIEERARTLAQFIETRLPGKTVNLIGHSMGGLDSRFMITHLKPTSFKVASLTTIATPHRGSAFADHVMLDVIGPANLPKLLQMTSALGIHGGGKAFEDLTVKNMTKFNDVTPDDPKVTYYSYGAMFQPSFGSLFKLSWKVIYEREGPNDGLVSLNSAKWANYQGTLNNVNHADLVGWTEPWRTITHPHGKTGFKVVPFYLKVIDSLARHGF